MGQIVKARSPITLRQKKNIARNSAHKTVRKAATHKGATKAYHQKSKTKRKNSSLKEQIVDLSSTQKSKTQKAKTSGTQKPPDKKINPNKTKTKAVNRKITKPPDKKANKLRKKIPKPNVSKQVRRKNIKKTDNNQNNLRDIPFIFQHKADNILYYTQSSEDTSLLLNDHRLSSETPIAPKSFVPISVVREPLSEYMILQKKRKQKQSVSQAQPSDEVNTLHGENSPISTDNNIKNENNASQSIHIKNITSEEISKTKSFTDKASSDDRPLPRSSSLVTAQQGPLHILAYWLRTSRYKLLNIFKFNKAYEQAQKKRSKADILNEIAGLRAENAMLRRKLGKSTMPNGRKKFEKA